MKVLHGLPSGGPGGSEKAAFETMQALQSQAVESLVIVPQKGALSNILEETKMPVFQIFFEWWVDTYRFSLIRKLKWLFYCARSVRQIIAVVRKNEPDLLITHTLAYPQVALAAWFLRVPHIWYVHEFGREDHKFEYLFSEKFSLWLMTRLSGQIIVNSVAVANKISNFADKQKINLIYYAIPIPNFSVLPSPDTAFQICMIGRLSAGKRQQDAILALHILNTTTTLRANLVLVGTADSVYFPVLESMIREYELESQIKFVGFTDNPYSYISQSNLMVVCSEKEAFGRITIEAMKIGTPVISADSGAGPELISHAQTGLLYTMGDAKALAKHILWIYENPDSAAQMVLKAKYWANEKCNIKLHSEQVMQVIDKLIHL